MAKRKQTILLIDDNPSILFNLQITLELNDFTVLTANDGINALEILDSLDYTPDLIISDIMMPNLDGYGLFKLIQSTPRLKSIPFIFLSANTSINGVIENIENVPCLSKPVSEDILIKTIKNNLK